MRGRFRSLTKRLTMRACERGTALVEFAVVAVLLLTLIFGIIDFGSAYNDHISVRQGARDGVRQAVTGRIGNDTSCPITGPAPTNPNITRLVCLAKERVGLNEERVRVAVRVNDPGAAGGPDRGSVGVCVMVPLRSITGFFPPINGNVARTEVQMRTEQTISEAGGSGVLATGTADGTAASGFSETPLDGQSWGFCTAEDT